MAEKHFHSKPPLSAGCNFFKKMPFGLKFLTVFFSPTEKKNLERLDYIC